MWLRALYEPFCIWCGLFRSSWHAASVSIIAQSSAMVLVLLAGRGLGADAYGKVGAVAAYFGWFGLIIAYAVHAKLPSLLAEHRHSPRKQGEACATMLLLALLFITAGVLLALLCMPYGLQRLHLTELTPVGMLYAAVFALLQFRVTVDTISHYAGWLQRWSVSNLVAAILPIVLLGGLLLLRGHFSPLQYMTLILLAGILSTAFTVALFLQRIGGWSVLRIDRSLIRPLLASGRGPWLALLSSTLVVYGVQTMIAANLPSRELAYYNVVVAMINWVALVGMAVSMPAIAQWSKLAAERRLDELRRDVRRRQWATGVVLTAASVLTAVFAAPLFRILYGDEFLPAAPLFRLCVPVIALSGFGGWYYAALFSLGHPGGVSLPNLGYALPPVILTYLTLRFTSLGVTGTVIGMDIGILLWMLVYELMFRRAYQKEKAADAEQPAVAEVAENR